MLDIQPRDFKILTDILNQEFTEKTEIYAFGSRVKNCARRYSDLDLLLKPEQVLSHQFIDNIQDMLSESDLSIKVDLVQWQTIDADFKAKIEPQLVRVK